MLSSACLLIGSAPQAEPHLATENAKFGRETRTHTQRLPLEVCCSEEVTPVCSTEPSSRISRRAMVRNAGKAAVASATLATVLEVPLRQQARAQAVSTFLVDAGVDRVVVLPGKTYLRGFAGSGSVPSATRPLNLGGRPAPPAPVPDGEARVRWAKVSGPGNVRFAKADALSTTATFSAPGRYILRLDAESTAGKASSTLQVDAESSPPANPLKAIAASGFRVDSPFWKSRLRGVMVNWIPHCIRQINRNDITVGPGGIDNFVEAGKKLRGEPHGIHKGFVFSNAWVYQTIESISLALTYHHEDDPELQDAHRSMRTTLDQWIPIILAAQEPDGYLQTAFTLPRAGRDGEVIDTSSFKHWDPARRPDHEGYVAGYLLEAAISHHRMTGGKDDRLYLAAKKLADCWDNNIGPAPKKAWFDEHQGMEQGLVRFGHYVNEVEGTGSGDRYPRLAKFLLDCRYHASVGPRDRREYSQCHLPVVEQYEAVGHAVRAAYTYSAMADIAMELNDPDYRSAAKSVWSNISHRKRYITGGIGSGETSEGFGPNYSLRNRSYCETCSSCGELFFQWKMSRDWQDARYVDLYEETLYNALAGSMDLDSKHFFYDNPLEARVARYQWHVCPCCVGNLPRTLLMLPTWIYTNSNDAIHVNLFVGSSTRLENVAGTHVELVQETNYPWNGNVSIAVNPGASKRFRLHIRIPNRNVSELYRATPSTSATPVLRVNGSAVKLALRQGYAVIDRTWKPGDKVEFEIPLEPQRVQPSQNIEALHGKVALRYGPLVYNVEQQDQDITKSLPPAAPLRADWRQNLLGGVTVLLSQFSDGSPLLAIPNYARMNREPGTALPPQVPPPNADGTRPPPPPPKSVVWITEG